jgi:hypothetical protein
MDKPKPKKMYRATYYLYFEDEGYDEAVIWAQENAPYAEFDEVEEVDIEEADSDDDVLAELEVTPQEAYSLVGALYLLCHATEFEGIADRREEALAYLPEDDAVFGPRLRATADKLWATVVLFYYPCHKDRARWAVVEARFDKRYKALSVAFFREWLDKGLGGTKTDADC